MVAISAGIAGVMPAPTAASLADRLLAPGVLPEALRLPLADYRDRIEAALGGRSCGVVERRDIEAKAASETKE